MHIILVGMMGSGKSTVGRLLAQALKRPFVDVDAQIEAAAGTTIAELFAMEGEAGFRQHETGALAAVCGQRNPAVIATGGGAVLLAPNRELLRKTGLVIWLDAPPAELFQRVMAADLSHRPLLDGNDPQRMLIEMHAARASAYRNTAHVRLETSGQTPERVAAAIFAILERRKEDGENADRSR